MSHSVGDNRSNYFLLLRQILLTLERKWRWFSIFNLEWLLFFHSFNALDSLLLSENRNKLCAMIVYRFQGASVIQLGLAIRLDRHLYICATFQILL